jgi:hypothetical protein
VVVLELAVALGHDPVSALHERGVSRVGGDAHARAPLSEPVDAAVVVGVRVGEYRQRDVPEVPSVPVEERLVHLRRCVGVAGIDDDRPACSLEDVVTVELAVLDRLDAVEAGRQFVGRGNA